MFQRLWPPYIGHLQVHLQDPVLNGFLKSDGVQYVGTADMSPHTIRSKSSPSAEVFHSATWSQWTSFLGQGCCFVSTTVAPRRPRSALLAFLGGDGNCLCLQMVVSVSPGTCVSFKNSRTTVTTVVHLEYIVPLSGCVAIWLSEPKFLPGRQGYGNFWQIPVETLLRIAKVNVLNSIPQQHASPCGSHLMMGPKLVQLHHSRNSTGIKLQAKMAKAFRISQYFGSKILCLGH